MEVSVGSFASVVSAGGYVGALRHVVWAGYWEGGRVEFDAAIDRVVGAVKEEGISRILSYWAGANKGFSWVGESFEVLGMDNFEVYWTFICAV